MKKLREYLNLDDGIFHLLYFLGGLSALYGLASLVLWLANRG